jgi:hypothetical protein
MSAFIESTRAEILRRLADGEPSVDILDHMCLAFEANVPGTRTGVTILDRSRGVFESATFPSLPPTYAEALAGIAVADKPGSCALAVFEGRTVVSTDVAADTRFAAAWKQLGADHGLEALVSIPVMGTGRKALGTFVVAYPPKAGLRREDLQAADAFAELCAPVLERRLKTAAPAEPQTA